MDAFSHQVTIDNGQGLVNPITPAKRPSQAKQKTKIVENKQEQTPKTEIDTEKVLNSTLEGIKAQRDEEWKRTEELQKRLEEREDSKLQRWVQDALKAGINPNLALGFTGGESGIVQDNTGTLDYTTYEGKLELVKQAIDNSFQMSENDKDRLMKLISTVMGTIKVSI